MDVIKSSRFWISIIIIVAVTLLCAIGKIAGDVAIASITGLLAGFGVAKTGKIRVGKLQETNTPPATALLPVFFVLLLGSSCGLTLSGKIEKTNQAIDAMSKTSLPIFNKICMSEAKKCADEKKKSEECGGWQKCDKARMIFDKALDVAQIACSSAYAMAKVDRKSEALVWLDAALKQIDVAYKSLKDAEVIK